MATHSSGQEPQETECPVCQDSFFEPKILPCGHPFCSHCIVSLMKREKRPSCPLCRHAFVNPTEKTATEYDYIATLPTDFALDELADSVDLLAKEPVCCVCDGVEAKSICVQCRDMLCSACTTVHNKLPVTRSHHVESLNTMTPERLAANRPALCADHGENQSLFCSNHGVAVCAYCLVADHRSCPEVKDLESEVKAAREEMRSLADILNEAEERMEETITKLDTCRNESTACKNLIDTAWNSLQSIFTEQKEAFSISTNETKSVEDARKTLRDRLAVVRSHKRILARTRKACPSPGVIYSRRALQQRFKTLDLKATSPDVQSISLVRMTDYFDVLRQVKRKIRELEEHKVQPESQEKQFTFHSNRGNGVLLSDNRQLAARINPGGVVVSCDAMEPLICYKIQVLDMDHDWQSSDIQFCGVTGTHPSDLNIKSSIGEMEDVSIICRQRNSDFKLDLKVKSIIALVIDPNSNLHLSADHGQVDIALKGVPHPCYVVFDLGVNVKKVRALPVNKTTLK